ncbi:MAG: carboxypeptidase regulatory-like domain-containing protein, partial [Planctomycetes bacterium]|nr:carboxypeptidase regulatory-like domain-containing protein [Planctomycetota bacterium]
ALHDLPALEGAVVAGAAGEVLPRVRRVSLREGDTQSVEVAFDGPALAGTVVDALTAKLVAGVSVFAWLEVPADGQADTIRSLGPKAWGAARPAGIDAPGATTDGGGRFRIAHVAGGRWRLYAGGKGWLSASQLQVDVDSDWTPDEVTLLVKAGAVVEGSVRWELAGPAGPEVIVELHSGSRGGVAGWVHASDGAYRLEGLAPGEYELRVRHMVPGGSQIHTQPLLLQEGERRRIDLELRP